MQAGLRTRHITTVAITTHSANLHAKLSDLDGAKYEIPVYDSFTDLGIILYSDLKFKEHILSRVKKTSMMLGIMLRNFGHLSDFTSEGLYKSLVRSQLEYGV